VRGIPPSRFYIKVRLCGKLAVRHSFGVVKVRHERTAVMHFYIKVGPLRGLEGVFESCLLFADGMWIQHRVEEAMWALLPSRFYIKVRTAVGWEGVGSWLQPCAAGVQMEPLCGWAPITVSRLPNSPSQFYDVARTGGNQAGQGVLRRAHVLLAVFVFTWARCFSMAEHQLRAACCHAAAASPLPHRPTSRPPFAARPAADFGWNGSTF